MDRVSQSILSNLHSVYDQGAGDTLALRVRHPLGLAWLIEGYALKVTLSGVDHTFDLTQHTMATLRSALISAGCQVAYHDPAFDPFSATILIQGAGNQSDSNGDHLYVYTAILWSIAEALGQSYGEAKSNIQNALTQMELPRSTGEWATLFGEMFSVFREEGESDSDYTARIASEVRRGRSNPASISANIKRLTGQDVEIREPWKEIHKLSESPIGDVYHMQGGGTWQYHIAQAVGQPGVRWETVTPQIMADRPAGTIFLDPATQSPNAIIEGSEIGIQAGREDTRYSHVKVIDGSFLSANLALSDAFILLNNPFIMAQIFGIGYLNAGLLKPFGKPLTFSMGEEILSEQGEISNDLNARFAGSIPLENGNPMMLSDVEALSDYRHELTTQVVDYWGYGEVNSQIDVNSPLNHGSLVEGMQPMIAVRPPQDLEGITRKWSGGWDSQTRWGDKYTHTSRVTSTSMS